MAYAGRYTLFMLRCFYGMSVWPVPLLTIVPTGKNRLYIVITLLIPLQKLHHRQLHHVVYRDGLDYYPATERRGMV